MGARAMHDDFKPQRTDYAEDGDVKAQIEKDIEKLSKKIVYVQDD